MSTTTALGNTVPEDDDVLAQVYAFMRTMGDELDRVIVRKTLDENVNNSAVLQDDNHLSFPVENGKSYAFDLHLFFNTTNAAIDAKIGLTHPAGTMVWGLTGIDVAAASLSTGDVRMQTRAPAVSGDNLAVGVTAASTNSCTHAHVYGTFVATATGTVRLQWAQVTATATNLTLQAGSYLRAEVI